MSPMAETPPTGTGGGLRDDQPRIARDYTPTALPSVTARWLAFVAILIGGACGALIGWSVTDLQCGNDDDPQIAIEAGHSPRAHEEGCTAWAGAGGVVGGAFGAGGTAVVSVLVLRAMAEWRRELELEDDQ
jgi:hypothetical protein